jgi:hypothetical protein
MSLNFDLFRTIASILGVPYVSRDSAGNASIDDGQGPVCLGKGAPVAITGSRNLTNADDGLTLVNKTGNNYVLTLPAGLRAGFSCVIIQGAAGTVALAASGGATVTNVSSYTKTGGAHARLEVSPWDTDKYVFSGDGAA